MTRILFVDDEPRILEGLRRMLRARRREWDMEFVVGGQAAIDAIEASAYDAVVTDMRMPQVSGVELLAHVQRVSPATIRIVLSGYTDPAPAIQATRVAHQFLTKPCNPDLLREVIDRVCRLRDQVPNEIVRRAIGGLDAVPVQPDIYAGLRGLLTRTDVAPETLAQVLGSDPAISAKILQVVNSSFFGTPRPVVSIHGAVRRLGPALIRDVVLSGDVFRPIGERGAELIPPREFRAHCLEVASRASRGDANHEDDPLYTAGLLHDIGKWVLADAVPDLYAEVLATAAARGCSPLVVEAERFGAMHDLVGAYLLGLWNLPPVVVDAVAGHHDPDRKPGSATGDAAVVWSANRAAYENAAGGGETGRGEPLAEVSPAHYPDPPGSALPTVASAGDEN